LTKVLSTCENSGIVLMINVGLFGKGTVYFVGFFNFIS